MTTPPSPGIAIASAVASVFALVLLWPEGVIVGCGCTMAGLAVMWHRRHGRGRNTPS